MRVLNPSGSKGAAAVGRLSLALLPAALAAVLAHTVGTAAQEEPAEEPRLVLLVKEAESLARRGQLDESLRRYEQALTEGAGSAQVLNRIAELYLIKGNGPRAVELLHRSLGERPAQLPVYSMLNDAFLAIGRLDSALHYVREALDLAPGHSGVRSQLAFLHLQAGDLGACRAQLDTALSLDDRNAHAHRLVGLYHTRTGEPDSAISRYQRVLELIPDDVESHNNIAFLLATQKRYAEALEWYDRTRAIARDPNLQHAIHLNMEAMRAILDGKMRARFILVPSEALALDILEKLEAGGDFGELAARFSQAPNARDGGDLGFFGPGEMLPEVESSVLELEVGEVSGPIRIGQGYMLLQRLN